MEIKQYKELLNYWQEFRRFTGKVIGKKSSVSARTTFDLEEHLKLYHCMDNFFYVLTDNINNSVTHAGGGIETMTGYHLSNFMGRGYVLSLKIYAIRELMRVMKGGVKYYHYLFSQPPENRKYIKANYTFEFRRKDGSKFQCMCQSIPVLFNEEMEPVYYLNIFTDISLLKTDKNQLHYIIDSSDIQNIKRIDIHVDLQLPEVAAGISKAEKRVLLLIADGKATKEIASELFLSEHTVSTHRKNMLKKLDCASSSEMIKKCILNGWI